jgi:hypothetical protein
MRPDELERRLRERPDALGPAPRAKLLRVLMLPDFDGADAIGSYWGNPQTRTFGELLIDCEEDRTLRQCSSGCARRKIADIPAAGGLAPQMTRPRFRHHAPLPRTSNLSWAPGGGVRSAGMAVEVNGRPVTDAPSRPTAVARPST